MQRAWEKNSHAFVVCICGANLMKKNNIVYIVLMTGISLSINAAQNTPVHKSSISHEPVKQRKITQNLAFIKPAPRLKDEISAASRVKTPEKPIDLEKITF